MAGVKYYPLIQRDPGVVWVDMKSTSNTAQIGDWLGFSGGQVLPMDTGKALLRTLISREELLQNGIVRHRRRGRCHSRSRPVQRARRTGRAARRLRCLCLPGKLLVLPVNAEIAERVGRNACPVRRATTGGERQCRFCVGNANDKHAVVK